MNNFQFSMNPQLTNESNKIHKSILLEVLEFETFIAN